MSAAFAELDAEYAADAGQASAEAPPPVPMLRPYWGEEGPSREWVVAQQRRTIRQWLERNALFAVIRREIEESCAAALAAEGLA